MKRTEESAWRAEPRWRIRRDGEIALGPGKADLLAAIARAGSISGAGARARDVLPPGLAPRRGDEPQLPPAPRDDLELAPERCRAHHEGRAVLAIYRQIEATSRAAARQPLTRLKRRLVP